MHVPDFETLFEQSFAWFFSDVDHLHVRLHHSVALSLNIAIVLWWGHNLCIWKCSSKSSNSQTNKQTWQITTTNEKKNDKKILFQFYSQWLCVCVWKDWLKETKKKRQNNKCKCTNRFFCMQFSVVRMWTEWKNSWWRRYSCWCFGDECIFKILRKIKMLILVGVSCRACMYDTNTLSDYCLTNKALKMLSPVWWIEE